MGAWDVGPFDNDDAADWAGDFDEADAGDRLGLVESALADVTGTEDYLEMDVCTAAVAAAATVAAVVPGGRPTDPVYGPQTLDDPGFEATDALRREAAAALRKVMSPESEWSELWAESGSDDAAREPLTQLIDVLDPEPAAR